MMNTLHSLLDRLRRDRGGNFGIMTAILLPVLIGAAGISIQVTDMLLSQRQLQEAADAAALATATALANKTIQLADAQAFARDFVAGQMANYLQDTADIKNSTTVNVSTTTSGKSVSYQVTVAPNYTINLNPMMRAVGFKTQNIAASGTTVSGHSETQGSVSMYLVLDRSGSMAEYTTTVNAAEPTRDETEDCSYYDSNTRKWVSKICTNTVTNYYTKIEALKLAVASLAGQLNTADPDSTYVRTGSVSYNDKMQTAQPLDWGTTKVVSYVNALSASGRTDSSAAFKKAYDSLVDPKEDKAHQDKTGQTPTKYIVFMTDGDNNVASADTTTKKLCDDARDKKIQVYTVALMAPAGGKALLNYCATTSAHYFAAENMTALLNAFKSIGAKAASQATRLTN